MDWRESDYVFMSRALQLARRGSNTTQPNPRVGCVIVRDNSIVAEGWHEFAGGPHAEINALKAAAEKAQGASCYITLEPCSHQGRTGPCSEALIQAGIANVIVAMPDPNPLVAGQGLQRLVEAGIATRTGLMEAEAARLNQGFIKRMCEKRPYIRCKLATSLDGRSAMRSGESKWITGAAARNDVQRLRAASAAIMTGIGTVLADDPGLDVRTIESGKRQPLRVILDRKLRFPAHAKMLSLAGRTLLITRNSEAETGQKLRDAGAEIVVMSARGRAFLPAVMRYLAEREEINEILLEAGVRLSGAMLEQGLVDEIILYQAAVLMGDAGKGLFHLPSIKSMQDKLALDPVDSRMVGEDRRMTFKVKKTR